MARKKVVKKEIKDKALILELRNTGDLWYRESQRLKELVDQVRENGVRETNLALLNQENMILKAQNEYFGKLAEDLIFAEDEESENGCGLTSCKTCS